MTSTVTLLSLVPSVSHCVGRCKSSHLLSRVPRGYTFPRMRRTAVGGSASRHSRMVLSEWPHHLRLLHSPMESLRLMR